LPFRYGWKSRTTTILLASGLALGQQSQGPAVPNKGKKVCVADVANSSMRPIFTDRLKERLVEDLQKAGVNAYNAYAATLLAKRLGISADNKLVMRREKCDFMLLSEVTKPDRSVQASANPTSGGAEIQLAVVFALFRRRHEAAALLQGLVPAAPADDPTTAALAAVDEVATQVAASLKRK